MLTVSHPSFVLQPGVGKSWYVYYLMHRVRTKGVASAVVWQTGKEGWRTLFKGDVAQDGGANAFSTELLDPKTWYVCSILGDVVTTYSHYKVF